MSEVEYFDYLMNGKNAAGVWAIIGSVSAAFITLSGVFINNFFENNRKRKERHRTVIFDSYIGALQYIAAMNLRLVKAGAGQIDELSNSDLTATEKFYNLSLVASPKVVRSFFDLSAKLTSAIFSLSGKNLDLKELKSEIDLRNNLMGIAQQQIEQALADMKLYNQKKVTNPAEFAIYQEQFDTYSKQKNQFLSELNVFQNKDAQIRLQLLKEAYAQSKKIMPDIFNLILLMRNDIERKIGFLESKAIKYTFDIVSEKVGKDVDDFIENLDSRISKLMQED